MAVICPTVTAATPEQYREQVEKIGDFTERIHIDFADGVFAPVKLISIIQAWWPDKVLEVDLHVMYERPGGHLESIVSLHPDLVVIHAEAKVDHKVFFTELKKMDIKVGVALLQHTRPLDVADLLTIADHVLIFSGDLGHFGGHADESLLAKVTEAKQINPDLEIGWDGGINADNAATLVRGGVDVLNTGGFIQKAEHPQDAYATLKQIVGSL